jgi:hypothetical protein
MDTPVSEGTSPTSMTLNVRYSFQPVMLPKGKSVELALPVGSTDPVVQSYTKGKFLNQYLVEVMLNLPSRERRF